MTVSSTTRKAGPFLGNDVTTAFPFTFKVFSTADVGLLHYDSANNAITLTLDSDYSIALNADQDNDPGGTITYPLSGDPLATGEKLVGLGSVGVEQGTDLTNLGRFLPQVIENALDKLTILTQQVLEKANRSLRVSPVDDSSPAALPLAADRAGMFLGFDAEGNPVAASGTGSDAALRTDLATSTGATLLGWIRNATGAVMRTVSDKLFDRVSAFDFMTSAQRADVRAGTLLVDVTDALQAGIEHCTASTQYGGKKFILPAGRYKATAAKLTIPREFSAIVGDGMWSSEIYIGATGGIETAAMPYLRPHWRDFAVRGTAASGKGIDFANVSNQVYLGEIKNVYVESGDNAFNSHNASGGNFFSMTVDNVAAYSHNGHSFCVACGPSVLWKNTYALVCGPGKAGYRLAGIINMESPNGLNQGDYWGVFGSDPAAADDFQDDFAHIDYPDITLTSPNVEEFASGTDAAKRAASSAILLHNVYRNFTWEGGKIDRNNLATPYHSVIRARFAPNVPGNPIVLNPGNVFLGAGVPSGAYLYADVGGVSFFDKGGALISAGATTWKEGANNYRMMRPKIVHDTSGETAWYMEGIQSQRLSVNMMRFDTGTFTVNSATPTCTGKTVWLTANTVPTTINTISYSTVSVGEDAGRNGFLIVQVEDNNTTFKHNFAAGNGLKLKGGVDYIAAKGDVLQFVRSNFFNGTQAGWVQI